MSSNKTATKAVKCQDCSWIGPNEEMDSAWPDITDLTERINPGDEVPAGTCPNCYGLVYLCDLQERILTLLSDDCPAHLLANNHDRQVLAAKLTDLFNDILKEHGVLDVYEVRYPEAEANV